MVKSEPKTLCEATSKPMPSPKSSLSSSSSSSSKKKYKGVRMRSWGSWVSEIRAPNQKTRIWLGSYSTAEAAARAYDAALLCLKGSSANFNFPNTIDKSSYQLPHDTAMCPKTIQRVAAAAANSFIEQQHHHNNNNNTNVSTPQSPSPSMANPSSPSSSSSLSYSSSSIASSPSMSSSTPEQLIDDNMSLANDAVYGMFTTCDDIASSTSSSSSMVLGNELWFDLSPKYIDPMVNNIFFDPSLMSFEEFYEEGDIPLWSFC